MGKPKSKFRTFYKQVRTKEGKLKSRCPYCPWEIKLNATRLKEHILSDCKNVPDDVRSKAKSYAPAKVEITSHFGDVNRKRRFVPSVLDDNEQANFDDDVIIEETQRPVGPKQQKLAVSKLTQDQMSNQEQENLASLFSQAVYATATSFRKFTHPYWQRFFSSLRPTFHIPTRKDLAGKYLTQEYAKLSADMTQEVALADSLSIGLDGWSNLRKDPIVNVLLLNPKPVFHKSIDTGSERHFATYYADIVMEVIEEKGDKNFVGFITDNPTTMQAAGRIVENKYPHICWYGCSMHSINLLICDLDKKVYVVSCTFSECSKITVEIRNTGLLYPIFKEKQATLYGHKKVALKVPGKTRFGSNFKSAKAVFKNKAALQALCVDGRLGKKVGNNEAPTINGEVRRLILSDEFWTKLECILTFLKPIHKWLLLVQTDRPILSQIMVCFKEIEGAANQACSELEIFSNEDREIIDGIIQDRKQFAVRDIHYAATLLDPFLDTDHFLTPTEKEKALSYIQKVAENVPDIDANKVSREYILFAAREGPFEPQHLWTVTDVSPLSWWKAHFKNTDLGKVAMRILGAPPTAAAIERSFSSQGRIHCKERNRLGTAKSGILTYLYENYRYREERTREKKKKSEESKESDSEEDEDDQTSESDTDSCPSESGFEFESDFAAASSSTRQTSAPIHLNRNAMFRSADQGQDDDDDYSGSDNEVSYVNPIPDFIP